MTSSRLDHVSVTVAELDRSLAFYQGLLQISVLGRGEDDGPPIPTPKGVIHSRFRFADLDLGGGQILELLQYLHPKRRPLHPTAFAPGGGHVGLRVSNLEAALRRLRRAGVLPRFRPIQVDAPSWWAGARVVYVSDPDGTTVELVQRPRASSATAQGRVR
jgi:catechol 2,3-dioxygenase-like lactoylglutathione lyase family enzyme